MYTRHMTSSFVILNDSIDDDIKTLLILFFALMSALGVSLYLITGGRTPTQRLLETQC
jgi:hypothetical protein